MPNRLRSILAFTLLLYAFLSAGAQDDIDGGIDGDIDGDVDLEDLDDEAEEVGSDEAATPMDEFDLSMPETDRKVRMEACFKHAMGRVAKRKDEVQQAIEQATQSDQQMTADQAFQSIVISSMIACYMNISPELVMSAGADLSDQDEAMVFNPTNVQHASKRQWDLLQAVIVEENQKAKAKVAAQQQSARQQKPPAQKKAEAPSVSAPSAGYSPGSQWMYVLIVFGMLFGFGFLGIARLMKSEQDVQNAKQRRREERDAKKGKKRA